MATSSRPVICVRCIPRSQCGSSDMDRRILHRSTVYPSHAGVCLLAARRTSEIFPLGCTHRLGVVAAGCLRSFVGLGATACSYGGRLPDIGTPGGDNPISEVILRDYRDGFVGSSFGNVLLHGSWHHADPSNLASLFPLFVFWELMLAILVLLVCRECRVSRQDSDAARI